MIPYHRPPLSKRYLRGEVEPADTLVEPHAFYDTKDVELVLQTEVAGVDPREHTITTRNGGRYRYRKLPSLFTYEGQGLPLVASARNTWTVNPEGDRTLLTSEAEVVLKGGRAGRLLEPLLRLQFSRMGPLTLAAFKYLVEQGEPPILEHAKLPRAPAACS
jgi:hypothetical protein